MVNSHPFLCSRFHGWLLDRETLGPKSSESVFKAISSDKIEALTLKYGTLGIFIAAFSPIPYKVFGWVAGMGEMEKKPFLLAGLCGRGLRFGLEAVLIGVYGNAAIDALNWFLDNEIILALVMILSTIPLWYGWKWWSNIEINSATLDSKTNE
jgi:membrane protein DedA with SNARE-associated domain